MAEFGPATRAAAGHRQAQPLGQALPLLERIQRALEAPGEDLPPEFADGLERLAEASADGGYAGLHDVCRFMLELVPARHGAPPGDGVRARYLDWLSHVRAYVDAPTSQRAVDGVLAVLVSPPRGDPVDLENLEVLRAMLRMPAEGPEEYGLDGVPAPAAPAPPEPQEQGADGSASGAEEDEEPGSFAFDLDVGSGSGRLPDGIADAAADHDDTYWDFTRAAFGGSSGARTTSTGRISALEDLDAARVGRDESTRGSGLTDATGTGRLGFGLDTSGSFTGGLGSSDPDGMQLPGEIEELRGDAPVDASDPAAVARALAGVEDGLGRLAVHAVELDQLALHDVIELTREALSSARLAGGDRAREALASFAEWPELLENHLAYPSERSWEALIGWITNPAHAAGVALEDLTVLTAMFQSETLTETHFDLELPGFETHDEAETPGEIPPADAFAQPAEAPAAPAPPQARAVESIAGAGAGSLAAPAAADGPPAAPAVEDAADAASRAPSRQALELMRLLVGEYEQLRTELDEGIKSDPAAAELRFDEALERFAAACEVAGLSGLASVCAHLKANIAAGTASGDGPAAELAVRLDRANDYVLAYLNDPQDPRGADRLVKLLAKEDWPVPLEADAAASILASLDSPTLEEGLDELPARPEVATSEAVSLALPQDVNPELLESLLEELPAQTEAFSHAVHALVAGGSGHGPAHDAGLVQHVDVAQRVAHTLKGAGNTVGVPGIANLTHHLEDILLGLRQVGGAPSNAVGEVLVGAADCLEAIGEYLGGAGSYPEEVRPVLQSVLDWANRADREGAAVLARAPSDAAVPAPVPAAAGSAEVRPPRGVGTGGVGRDEAHPQGPPQSVRVPASLVDDLLRLVGETIILTGQVHEQLRRSHEQNRAMIDQLDHLRQLGGELEAHIDLSDIAKPTRRLRAVDPAGGEAFDPLEMDEYNELHTVSRRLVEAATDARELGHIHLEHLASLDDMLVTQGRLNRETQEAVLRTRMVPVRSVLPRLQRAVRQTCRQTGKRVEAEFAGTETLMDSDVLNNIVDPLMHLVRNAIDHGIEPPAEREAAGKPAAGTLALAFSRDGSQVLVRCTDDGRGIDFEAIRSRATALGLAAPGADLSRDELTRFLFRSNFTTRDEVTQVSGRGVGLDAVYSRIVELGGSIELQSERGRHCTVELRLPVTLISTHALLVRCGDQVVALANRGVEQIVHAQDGELLDVGQERMFKVGGDAYPARPLEIVLGVGAPAGTPFEGRPVVLVRGEAGLCAVLPEAVLGSQDLVVKGLGPHVPKLRGIIGVTILGDGSVTPVLDLPELLRTAWLEAGEPAARAAAAGPGAAPAPAMPSVLVVDDSLSSRRSLAQVMRDYGYDVRTARDGLEAVNEIQRRAPDIMLTDMEMPRMNGIELARHARGRAPTAAMPIVMITSRATRRHREQARAAGVDAYLTKPFSEAELLRSVEALLGTESRQAAG